MIWNEIWTLWKYENFGILIIKLIFFIYKYYDIYYKVTFKMTFKLDWDLKVVLSLFKRYLSLV